MGVFRSYDVRGIYGEDIDEDFAYRLGRAFVQFTGAGKVAVGRDARESSPDIADSLIEGLTDQGADVVYAGLVTTPMLYYLSALHDEFDGAIMVSASHNPPDYTGFKLCRGTAEFINRQNGSLKIKELMEAGEFGEPEKGETEEEDFYDEYIDFIADAAKEDLSGLKLVIDTGNGCVGPLMSRLIEELELDAEEMYFEPDGHFPNHPPNPLLPESQEEVKKKLREGDYDAGIMVDADGDRMVFLDEEGNMIKSSSVLQALCDHYYRDRKVFACDVLNYRNSVISGIEECGGELHPGPVGYANVKAALLEADGVLGCEFSGHYQHEEVEYCDNASLAMVKVLTCMAKTGEKLSELVEPYEGKVLTQVNFEVEDKDEKIRLVDDSFDDPLQTLHIDGVSKTYPDFWFNVRKSNTEPLLRVTVEADTEEAVEEVIGEVKAVIGVSGEGERYA